MAQETQHHHITVLGTLSLTRVRHLNFPLDSPDLDHNWSRLKVADGDLPKRHVV